MLYYLLPVWNRGGQPIGLLPASGSLFFMEWFLPAAWVSSVGVKGWIEGVEVSFVQVILDDAEGFTETGGLK